MSEFRAGSAVGVYKLDISQAEAAANRLKAIFAEIKAEAAKVGTVSSGGGNSTSSRTRDLERLRDSEIRAARAAGEHERALMLVNNQIRASSPNTVRYNNLLAQQSQIQRQALRPGLADQFGASLKNNFLSILGPAALATAGIVAVGVAAQKTEEAFRFKADLDLTTDSINSQLGSVRDMGTVWAQAADTAKKYRLTQSDTNAILASSVDVLRTSKASVGELEIALLRLGSRDPTKPISEAARALRELNSGDVTTIKEIFNVGAADALRMKNEIQGGADAVQVLTKYLDSAGSGMNILEQRTTGATGKMLQLRVETEKLTLALGEGATGPGLAILNAKLIGTQTLTADLRGNWEALADANQAFALTLVQTGDFEAALAERTRILDAANREASTSTKLLTLDMDEERHAAARVGIEQEALALRLGDGRRESILLSQASQDAAIASRTDASAKELQALKTDLLNRQTQAAANAFLAANPGIKESGIRAAIAAGLIPRLTGELSILTSQIRDAKSELAGFALGRPEAGGDALNRSLEGPKKNAAFIADQERRALQARRDQLLSTGTHAQKLAELNRVYQEQVRLFGPNSAEAISAQTRLIQERNSTAKSHTSDLNSQLKLNESIYDSQQKQYRAALDLEELTIRNRQETRAEDDKIRRLNITANTASDLRIRAAAQDAIALIDVERRQRAAEIGEKQGITGAPIVNGRILESLRGGATGGSGTAPTAPGVSGGAAAGAGTSGALTIVNQFYVDSKLLLEVIEPQIIANALAGQRASLAGGGGLGAP